MSPDPSMAKLITFLKREESNVTIEIERLKKDLYVAQPDFLAMELSPIKTAQKPKNAKIKNRSNQLK